MKSITNLRQIALLILTLSLSGFIRDSWAQTPPDCFTPDHYTLWVYTESSIYICNSNEDADGTEETYIGWDTLVDNNKVTLWILSGPDYYHPDLGWRPYLSPSSFGWGTCNYSAVGSWQCTPSIGDLHEWGANELDIFPEFPNPGLYTITGTHPGWTCSGGQCGTTVSSGADSINIHLVKTDVTAYDLFQTVSGDNLIDPGVFIHFNTDNDNSNSNFPPTNTAILDYTESTSVTNENDLKKITISLTSVTPHNGTVTLTRSGNFKIWSSPTKDTGTEITFLMGSKSWDLSNLVGRIEFNSIKDNLWVEGCATGNSGLIVTYEPPLGNGIGVSSKMLIFHFIAAVCGDHSVYAYLNPPQFSPYEPWTKLILPNIVHCEWSRTGDVNGTYNCIAWSVDETGEYYGGLKIEQYLGGTPDFILTTAEVLEFYRRKKGWTPINSGSDIEKADQAEAFYFPTQGNWDYISNPDPVGFHAARRKRCSCGAGKWIMYESKLGEYHRIEHVWNQLDGSRYDGSSKIFLKSN